MKFDKGLFETEADPPSFWVRGLPELIIGLTDESWIAMIPAHDERPL